MSLVSMLKRNGKNGFGYGSTAEHVTDQIDLTGKTYLITGCNSGLGLETMRVLTLRGAQVIAAARTEEKAKQAMKKVSATGMAVSCELSTPSSVRSCIKTIQDQNKTLDALICNAGIMALPKLQQKQGIELQFFTNHIGHFILVNGLLDSLSEKGRVVMLSSEAHRMSYKEGIQFENLSGEKAYTPWKAYGQSKLANLYFAQHLAKRLEGTGKTANAVHPGVIKTNLSRHMHSTINTVFGTISGLFFKNVYEGAATQCFAATHPSLSDTSGQYFADCNLSKTRKYGQDNSIAEKLWSTSEEIVEQF